MIFAEKYLDPLRDIRANIAGFSDHGGFGVSYFMVCDGSPIIRNSPGSHFDIRALNAVKKAS